MQLKREVKFLQEGDPLQPLGVGEKFVMGGFRVDGLCGMVVENVPDSPEPLGLTMSTQDVLCLQGGEVAVAHDSYTGRQQHRSLDTTTLRP